MKSSALIRSVAAIAAALVVTTTSHAQDQDAPPAKGAATPPPAPKIVLKDPVATVNGKTISSAELEQNLNAQLESAGRTTDSLPPEALLQGYHRILDDMITDSLLDEKAKDVDVPDAEVEEQFSRIAAQFESEAKMNEELAKSKDTPESVKKAIRSGLQKRKWIESRVEADPKISDAEAQKFYDGHADAFDMPERVRASHILIATPETLTAPEVATKMDDTKKLKERINKGEDFAKLAKEFSEDPGSKDSGGDLNFFTKDRMVPEFADAAFGMKPGEVSEPVKTQFGYHIIKVTDRKAAGKVPFGEEKERIIKYLQDMKKREGVQQLLQALRSQSDVKINLPPLPAPTPAPVTAPVPAPEPAPANP